MKPSKFAAHLFRAALAASALLLAGGAAHAQQQINLTAAPAVTTLPDGNVVPMWGYNCGAVVGGSTATCRALNASAPSGQWSPVVITVPIGQDLQINLANNLSFATGAGTNNVPTSLTIVGQLGFGTGSTPTYVQSLAHPQQGQTWPVANAGGTVFTPPAQPARVQSFATEVAAGSTATLCWGACGAGLPALKPGTYLIESGTHPSIQGPMGLYGILVVTNAPSSSAGAETAAGTAYPATSLASTTTPFYPSTGVSYDAEVPILLSEIDPALNNGVQNAVMTAGFDENASQVLGAAITSATLMSGGSGYTIATDSGGTTSSGSLPITFSPQSACKLLPSGTATITNGAVTDIQLNVITSTANGTSYGTGCVQAVTATVAGGTTAASITLGMSSTSLGVQCSAPPGGSAPAAACYPPAVNYTPTYYLVNGSAFDKTNAANSLYPTTPGTLTGSNLLVRIVNAGLRLHVPSIVGATTSTLYSPQGKLTTAASIPGLTLVAEDGNPVPGVPRVQSEVIMPAGKTYDILINAVPACTPPSGGSCTTAALPLFDRELSLSGATSNRDAGMLAFIGANGGTIPTSSALGAAAAHDDSYNVLLGTAGQVVSVSDPSKGVIANDVNVYGVTLLTNPGNGTVTLNRNGTFTYTATGTASSDSFTYCANGTVTGGICSSGVTATVTLAGNSVASAGVSCGAIGFASTVAGYYTINPPGVLAACTDAANLTMRVQGTTATAPVSVAMSGPAGATGTAVIDANGGFQASVSAAGTYTFPVSAVNSLGLGAPKAGTVTITFPSATGLTVNVIDGADKTTLITDYRWVIEEDRTFYVDPNCTANPLPAGCPTVNTQGAQFNYGTSFHTSSMPVVAVGCTGPVSCEGGQTLQNAPVVCDVGNGVCRPDGTGNGFTATMPSQVNLDPTKRYYISIMPGDAANPFIGGYTGSPQCAASGGISSSTSTCGHGMGGSPINKGQTTVMVLTQPSPYPTAHVTAFIYEDDYPLNGEHDAGGGVDVLAAQEPGLGGFQILLQDVAGGTGGMTGTPTYDMFNQPLSNAMAGTIDPVTLLDACPISTTVTANAVAASSLSLSTSLAAGATSFTVAATSVPAGLGVGATLADNAGAIPAGATVTGIATTATSYTVTMSAAATRAALTDIVTVTGAQAGITGMVVTCPKYESDGKTLSPIAGMAMINNLYPGRYSVQAIPGADRIARGEEWLQTNTLDGQKAHDAFLRIGEPAYFQEYGPSGFHVNIGYANPKIINNRRHNDANSGWCDSGSLNSLSNGNGALVGSLDCSNTVKGKVYLARMSRTPDERLYSSGSRTGLAFTQCFAALSDPDGATFAFTKCDPVTGEFSFGPTGGGNNGVPAGNWMLTIFDQWNDQIIDGISQPVGVACLPGAGGGLCSSTTPAGVAVNNATGTNQVIDLGEVATHQWQSNIYTRTFIDTTGTGLWKDSAASAPKPGVALVPTNIRFRDGSISNLGSTDTTGAAPFNELFPLFNWYVVETDDSRFKTTGVHIVYDAGGPVDNSSPGGSPCYGAAAGSGLNPCGNSDIGTGLANTYEKVPLPADLRIPGAVYCGIGTGADCYGKTIASGSSGSDPVSCSDDATNGGVTCSGGFSTGRIDPPLWWGSYGWQGYSGQGNFIEWGKKPFAPNETGGIRGHVVYASTRPYDNPALLLQNQWEPLVPHVIINLYQQTMASDGVTPQLTLIDTTTTTSWDDWAQGYRTDASGNAVTSQDAEGGAIPNISCAGQSTADLFFYGIKNQPEWMDFYNNVLHGTAGAVTPTAYNSQFKCYDGMHTWNQLQPAPYDGMYSFPSVKGYDPATGKPTGTNCTACVTNVDASDPFRYSGSTTVAAYTSTSPGTPVLPAGNYVVEVVVPPGFQLVKEEDKNILIGDNYIAPAVNQIPGLATNIFILPDQAAIGSTFNVANAQNPTNTLGRNALPNSEADTGMQEQYWPCVGALRQVPDYISLFPQSQQVSPFAGAMRNLCDRKAVTLNDQSSAQVKFFIFTPTHIAGHFTGIILDDFTSEFDPYSPQFGEKFAPSFLPVSIKDWQGNEVNRVYSDQFGLYNGLSYSTWEVNPPNPTGYAPTMMIACMNDAGYGTVSPWWDTTAVGTTSAKRDPFFEYGYSQFCYELPFMPGRTGYFDTPVTPDAAFTDGYNHPDCSYPNLTPAIASVSGSDGVAGPWVKAAGSTLTITALGDQQVENYGYSGPSITTAPYNAQQITRHYGFGTSQGTVTIGGVPATVVANGWSDGAITVTVPAGIPPCPVQQQVQFGQPATTTTATGTATGTFTARVTNGSAAITVSGTVPATLAVGDPISGTGIPAGATVKTISNRTITLSANATRSSSGETVTFTYTTTTVTTTPVVTACGQLQITTAGGQTSVDTVTVTVGGKQPTVLASGATIQSAIDAALPGDMIIVPPGVYNEMVIMWKPVRLQGVGAASAIIDASTQPAGKLLNPWRTRIDCLFGLTTGGRPRLDNDNSCASGWSDATGYQSTSVDAKINDAVFPTMMVDRLPFEAVLGWDATLNGNLAEQSIEPSLMGAEEGAAITVLGKGVRFGDVSGNATGILDAFGSANGALYPVNTVLLSPADCQANTTLPVTAAAAANPSESFGAAVGGSDTTNRYPGNFYCNPSAIDGLGLRDASQGGGGIYVHAYAHYLQIANNRIYNNLGTLSGGITIGQGEHPDANLTGTAAVITSPNSCEDQSAAFAGTTNVAMPFCFDVHVNVHNNAVYENVSLGDELFSSTPAGAGGISVNTGADYYNVSRNLVCGNLSSGDGGGFSHIGFIKDGTVANNQILFNKSANPSISTNGAGLLVMGAPDVDPTCGANNDQDCVALPATVTPSDGSGPGLVVDANLILGNSADAGSGGGVRLQHINGKDIINFPNQAVATASGVRSYTSAWNHVSLTNNIIVNNVAGWDGGGISLQDALYVDIVNDTVAHNDSTATAGPLFGSLFAPMSSAPTSGVGCFATANGVSGASGTVVGVASCPQVAGIASVPNSAILKANTVAATGSNASTALACPAGYGGTACWTFSSPLIFNDLVWQNRSFIVTTGGLGSGAGNQQQVVTLMNADASFPASNVAANPTSIQSQTATGMCPGSGSAYWDLGVQGDQGPTKPQSAGVQLQPYYSALDDLTLYTSYTSGTTTTASHNVGGASFAAGFVQAYCNGGRTPPEAGGQGWFTPPGTNETNGSVNGGSSNPNGTNPMYFSLVATATTDEGNNWINMRWGPLSLTNPVNDSATSNLTAPQYLGNYAITGSSNAIAKGAATEAGVGAPSTDYLGNPRPSAIGFDIGAVEFEPPPAQIHLASTAVVLGNVQTGQTGTATVLITNPAPASSAPLYVGTITVSPTTSFLSATSNCPSTGLAAGGGTSCTLTITFAPTGSFATTGTSESATVTISSNAAPAAPAITAAGTAWPPQLSLSPTPTVNFGTVEDKATGTQQVTVTNTGYGPWLVKSGTGSTGGQVVTGTGYSLGSGTGACASGTSVAVGGSCTVFLNFTSSASVTGAAGTLTVTVNADLGATTTTVEQTASAAELLTANSALPAITVGSNASYSFGSVQTGRTASTTWTLTNSGTDAIVFASSGFVLGGANANRYTTTNTCVAASPLPVGGSCSVTLVFSPTTAGTGLTANVAVSSEGYALTTLTGTGNGVAPAASLAPSPGAFGNQPDGVTSAPITFTYTNTGIGPITVAAGTTGVALSGGNANQFAISANSCSGATLPPTTGNTCTVSVTFTPATAGNKTATLTVTDVGGGAAAQSVSLTGTGVSPTPTLSSVTPNTGVRGTTVPVTLTGTNFTAAATVGVSGSGVTCTVSGTPTATSLSASCAITATAGIGGHNVTVSTVNGNSNPIAFTVANPPAATVTSVTPNAGVRGTTLPVALVGTNFTATGTTVAVSGGGVTCTVTGTPTATTANASCAISAGAGLGAHNLTVTNLGGTASNAVTFTVTGATVAIGAPSPVLTTGTANTTTKTGTITVSNAAAATGALTLGAAPTIAKVGGAGGTFSIVAGGTCVNGAVVNPGGSCTINVQYVPGTSTATATANVTISGTGMATTTLTGSNFSAN